jgi:hypothetical protein
MSTVKRIDPKATITVADYLTIERLVRERPSLSNLEKAVQLFPTCAIFWSTYLDFLLENPEKAIKVAERAVAACCQIELWRRYLSLAKSMYRLPEVFPIYERSISAIGTDSKSSDFWIEYLYIVRALYNTQVLVQFSCLEDPSKLPSTAILVPLSPAIPPGLNTDLLDVEGLKLIQTVQKPTINSIREIFHSALFVPMERIDAVWDEYQAFEQVIANSMVAMAQSMPTIGGQPPPAMLAGVQASKLLTEYSTRWGQSKQGLKELERIYANVNAYFAPLPLDSASAETVRPNIVAWRRVIAFEKSNPFKLPYTRFRARMDWVLNQSLLSNVYVSEFWIEKALWCLYHDGPVAALSVLESVTREYLAHDVLLRLVIACLYEERGEVSKAQSVYVESLSHFTSFKKPAPALLMHYIRFSARCLSKVHARAILLDQFSHNSIHIDARVMCAFAKLELRCFNSSENARKIIELAIEKFGRNESIDSTLNEINGTQKEYYGLASSLGDALVSSPFVAETVLQNELLSLVANSNIDEDMIVDVSGEERDSGGVRRPELSKMMSFRPGVDETASTAAGSAMAAVPKQLLALVELLPRITKSTVPDTDVVLGRIQRIVLPPVAISRRLEDDGQMETMRRQREEKRLLAASAEIAKKGPEDGDVVIKSDLFLEEERDQRQFLSALANNIHRERVYYKRHKLITAQAVPV